MSAKLGLLYRGVGKSRDNFLYRERTILGQLNRDLLSEWTRDCQNQFERTKKEQARMFS